MTIFYFRKGDNVPSWLLRTRCANTGALVDAAVFCTNGKVCVMPDGDAYIWPSSTRFKYIIHIPCTGLPMTVDASGFQNHMYNFDNGVRTFSGAYRKLSPLAYIRSLGVPVYTSTKCVRIPELYHRA